DRGLALTAELPALVLADLARGRLGGTFRGAGGSPEPLARTVHQDARPSALADVGAESTLARVGVRQLAAGVRAQPTLEIVEREHRHPAVEARVVVLREVRRLGGVGGVPAEHDL